MSGKEELAQDGLRLGQAPRGVAERSDVCELTLGARGTQRCSVCVSLGNMRATP